MISDIWKHLLNVEVVGIHDNFFDLGGHSLLLMQAHARLRGFLNHEFPVMTMFRYPTISSLAKFLNQEQESDSPFLQSLNSSREKLIAGKSRREQVLGKRKRAGSSKKQ